MDSQNKAILAYLETGKAITPITALRLFGCFRLSARIFDLKAIGVNITKMMIERDGKHFAEYRIKATPEALRGQ